MSPTGKFMAFAIATVITVGMLRAQPDPVLSCRRQASGLVNTMFADTSAERRGGLSNGNDMVLWKAKLSDGHHLTGFCEVNPQTGRVVRLGSDQDSGDVNRAYRMTPVEAEKICAREARARFSPGNGMIDAIFQPNSSSKSVYQVGWRWDTVSGAVRKGRCEIDSATGRVRGFHANLGW